MLGKKALMIIGGSNSELGSAIIKRFSKSRFNKWKVFNIDYTENPEAGKNFVIPEKAPYSPSLLESL